MNENDNQIKYNNKSNDSSIELENLNTNNYKETNIQNLLVEKDKKDTLMKETKENRRKNKKNNNSSLNFTDTNNEEGKDKDNDNSNSKGNSFDSSMDSNISLRDTIFTNSNFVSRYIALYFSLLTVYAFTYISDTLDYTFIMKLVGESEENNFTIDAFNLITFYNSLFVFGLNYIIIYAFEIDISIYYSLKRYTQLGFKIHQYLLFTVKTIGIYYIGNLLFCKVYLNFFTNISQSTIDLFNQYIYFSVLIQILYFIFLLTTRLLSITNKFHIVIINTSIAIVAYVILSPIFIVKLNMGITGMIITKLIVLLFLSLVFLIYLYFSEVYEKSIFGFRKNSMTINSQFYILKRYTMFTPLMLANEGIFFCIIAIALWINKISFYTIYTYMNIFKLVYAINEPNSICLVMIASHYVAKNVKGKIFKRMLHYSALFQMILLIIVIAIILIFKNLIYNLYEEQIIYGNNLNTISSLHTNNYYYKMYIRQELDASLVYFIIYCILFSINRLFLGYFRALNNLFISSINPLIVQFFFKTTFAILLGKVYLLHSNGVIVSMLITELLYAFTNLFLYNYDNWKFEMKYLI